jgi:ATP-dependent RNA helicase DeaD
MEASAPAGAQTSLPLSVAIVCKNNERTIGKTLASVTGLAREIVALDSGSTDGTMGILRAHGARIEQIAWKGHIATKQMALEACSQPWILSIDSDESLEPALAQSLRKLLEGSPQSPGSAPSVAGARVNRKVWYAGRFLDHTWQPEWRLRLVRREDVLSGRAHWTGVDPHDRLDVAPSAGRVIDLQGDLRHDSIHTMSEFLAQQVRLGQISARAMLANGRRPSRARLLFSPLGQVFKQLVLKGAWRDGWRGWAAVGSAAVASLAKHTFHMEAQGLAAERQPEGVYLGETSAGNARQADRSASSQSSPPTMVATALMTDDRHEGASAPDAEQPQRKKRTRTSSKSKAAADNATGEGSASTPAVAAGDRTAALTAGGHDGSEANSETGSESGSGVDGGEGQKKKRRRRRSKKKPTGGARTASSANDNQNSDDFDDENDQDDLPTTSKGGNSGAKTRSRRDVDSSDADVFDQTTTFADLGLSEGVLKGLNAAGFERPTYIQKQLIPPALAGRDVLGQAKTGTGKTAAFGLPLLSRVQAGIPMQAIILGPTRELAIQITDEINDLGRYTGVKAVTIYGGQRMQSQIDKLNQGPEIIVGTPGRVLDMLDRGYMHFQNIRFAVLDEVDRMFDIGFRDDIRKLLRKCPKERQTLVVSATVSGEIEELARQHMNNPEKIVTSAGSLTVNLVEQHYLSVEGWDKKKLLLHLLTHEEPALTLVFCRLKRRVDEVAKFLNDNGIESHAIHGDMSQSRRTSTMRQFQDGKLAVLVASDVAARGIDVGGITHVVNYDLPEDPEVYVHRIGRTARAGRRGVAWTFTTREQGKLLSQIEDLINIEIPKMDYPDFIASERPSSWRDETPGGRPPVIVTGVPVEAKNRFATDDKPIIPMDDKTREQKFPGGIIPSQFPLKRMRGRVKPGR